MGVDVMRIETENVGQNDTDQEFILWLYQEFYRLMFYTAQKYVQEILLTCQFPYPPPQSGIYCAPAG